MASNPCYRRAWSLGSSVYQSLSACHTAVLKAGCAAPEEGRGRLAGSKKKCGLGLGRGGGAGEGGGLGEHHTTQSQIHLPASIWSTNVMSARLNALPATAHIASTTSSGNAEISGACCPRIGGMVVVGRSLLASQFSLAPGSDCARSLGLIHNVTEMGQRDRGTQPCRRRQVTS